MSSPVDYDEELVRVLNFSMAAKEAIPGVKVAAPSTCSWWYCAFVPFFFFPNYNLFKHDSIQQTGRARLDTRTLRPTTT
jgi:hypothetical protein